MALPDLGLPLDQLADLCLHQLLVEHLPAGDAVDLRAQRRNAVLICLLQARLPRRCSVDQVVSEHEVGRRQKIADGYCGEGRADGGDQPRTDLEMTDIIAPRNDDRVRFLAPAEDR